MCSDKGGVLPGRSLQVHCIRHPTKQRVTVESANRLCGVPVDTANKFCRVPVDNANRFLGVLVDMRTSFVACRLIS